jgi:ribosomal-protein-alanine N-acetyltransferase
VDVPHLRGRRLLLRPLARDDYEAWRDVRRASREWLERWEPRRPPGETAPSARDDFVAMLADRAAEHAAGTGYSFGIFADDGFAGAMNMRPIERGPFQSARLGYWIDERVAGRGYMPEAIVLVLRFAFGEAGIHRVEANVIPRNAPSRRVMEKLGFREEGLALRYLQIAGVWEDHVRYAMTAEDWASQGAALEHTWLEEE